MAEGGGARARGAETNTQTKKRKHTSHTKTNNTKKTKKKQNPATKNNPQKHVLCDGKASVGVFILFLVGGGGGGGGEKIFFLFNIYKILFYP